VSKRLGIPIWSLAFSAASVFSLIVMNLVSAAPFVVAMVSVILAGTVFAAVYHAEVIAHRLGEPYGTLVLAVAVTVIEVALIVAVMIGAPEAKAGLARDTVFAAVMIVCNGIVGLCLLVGGVRHHEQGFQLKGASAALAVLAALTTLTLIVPNVTTTTPGPTFSRAQLVFAGLISLVLYCAFIFVQTMRHRDYFLPIETHDESAHAPPPSDRTVRVSMLMLVTALVAVVLIAKQLTPTVEWLVATASAPRSVIAIVIAMLVLLPEGLAAVRAAHANRLQTSLNLALGSALASIGLTIPAVVTVSLMFNMPLQLGLSDKDTVLLALTLLLGTLTLGTGRTTILQGVIHLVVFAAFLFFAVVP
jgi:Ca2+:H+ antiporter